LITVIRREILPPMNDLLCSPESLGSSVGWCMQYLSANPFDQKKIQDEIDALDLRDDEFPAYETHSDK
jgi:hypothetical protein